MNILEATKIHCALLLLPTDQPANTQEGNHMTTKQPDPWADSLEVGDKIGILVNDSFNPCARIATVTNIIKTQIHTEGGGKGISKWSKATCRPIGRKYSRFSFSPSIVPLDNPEWIEVEEKILVSNYHRNIKKALEGVKDLKILKEVWLLMTTGDPS